MKQPWQHELEAEAEAAALSALSKKHTDEGLSERSKPPLTRQQLIEANELLALMYRRRMRAFYGTVAIAALVTVAAIVGWLR